MKKTTLCKQCKNCCKHTVERTNRNGDIIKYTYCDGLGELPETDWQPIVSGYLISTKKLSNEDISFVENKTGKDLSFMKNITNAPQHKYLHHFAKTDSQKTIDHIDHNKSNNCLDNLCEVSQSANNQNKNTETFRFNNVRKNKASYTAYRVVDGETINIGCFDTDIKAYDAFVNFSKMRNLQINPNLDCYIFYNDVKTTNSPYNNGIHTYTFGGTTNDYENL